MNILLIGNGFDLAHGLPTSYGDFLDYVESTYNPISEKMKENFWIDAFIKRRNFLSQNWVDIESEISKIVQRFETFYETEDFTDLTHNNYKFLESIIINQDVERKLNKFFDHLRKVHKDYTLPTKENIVNFLGKHLLELVIYLEGYLRMVTEKLPVIKTPDINKNEINKVINFNYTDTFFKLYDTSGNIEYDYIHGKIGQVPNNMVLGVNEYLPELRKNQELDFVAFKKYFQRIYKKTGCKYREWIEEIETNNKSLGQFFQATPHNLYIFGHSLDVTDKDILSELILLENMYTTIYMHSPDVYKERVINLIKIIGQDNLTKFVHGANPKIKFQLQQDMIPAPVPATK